MQNLYNLLNKYLVEIPIIQRDYAQGRKDKRVEIIRVKFIESLLKAIDRPDESALHLDFIYGKLESQSTQDILESNYNHIESILAFVKDYTKQTKVILTDKIPEVNRTAKDDLKQKMQPLDGQQRLTTLWITHFVLYNNSKLEIPKWMSNFTYKTRKSSTEFINGLITDSTFEARRINSENITNSKWFYKVWEQDPTVKGILVTIDEVQKQLDKLLGEDIIVRNQKLEILISNLVDEQKSAVNFSFLPLSDIDVEDDIYIKMNDRGKQLTNFEVFKNDLLNFLKLELNSNDKFTIEEYNSISKKFDIDWLDLFWKNKDLECYDVEFEYHYYILYYLLLYELKTSNKTEDISDDLYFKDLVGENTTEDLEHLNFSYLKSLDLINLKSLKYVFESLDSLIKIENSSNLNDILNTVTFKKRNPENNFLLAFSKTRTGLDIGYYDRVFNYALCSYLTYYENEFDEQEFESWCRILQNLVYNQAYIQGKRDFELAIKNVNEIIYRGKNIENTLTKDIHNLTVFSRQRDEERLKVLIYKKNPEALNHFINLEQNEFFQGQIQFVIDLATSSNKNPNTFNLDVFIEISKKTLALFDSSFASKSEWLLQRAMMTKGFEFKPISSSRREIFSNNFSSLRFKEEGWRWLFKSAESASYRDIFRELLEAISIESFEKDLIKMIDEYNQNDWKYFFIKEPSVFKAAKSRLIKFSDVNNIRLLTTNATNGRHSELRSKYFQHNFNWNLKDSPFKKSDYFMVTSRSDEPCFYFYDWQLKQVNYHFDIRYLDSGEFELRFLNNTNDSLTSIDPEIKIILEEQGFEKEIDYGYIKLIKNTSDIAVLKNLNKSVSSTLLSLNTIS